MEADTRTEEARLWEKRQTGSHLILIHPETRRRAVVPVHKRDVPKGTLLSILKTAALSSSDI